MTLQDHLATKPCPEIMPQPARRAGAPGALVNAMSVDVEDYFQVQAFAGAIGRAEWDHYPCRVEANIERVLRLFGDRGVKASFFTLGWIAERYPAMVRTIVAEGHELASHGYAHVPVYAQGPDEFRADVRKTKRILEDIGQVAVQGYRAATFSIGAKNLWALDVLAEEGYRYGSSIYPVKHDLYGMPDAPRFAYRPGKSGFIEIPMTTFPLFGRNLPCSGGGYFRLLPYALSRWALARVNGREAQPCVFYFHPWEVDPGQPRVKRIPLKSRVRHYLNLARMEGRLARLLEDFAWNRIDRIFLAEGN